MKFHPNAALSWTVAACWRAVVVEGWTLAAAAEAGGVSARCARKWIGRYRLEGEQGLLDRSSAPRRVANRTAADRVAAIVSLRRLRMTGAEIAEMLGMPLSTVSGILTRIGLGARRLGLEPPSATSARGRASSCTSTSRSSAGSRAAPATASRGDRRLPRRHRRAGTAPDRRLGVRARRGRRRHPARLRRGARRREGRDRGRLPAPRRRLLSPPRHHGRTDHDRRMKVKWTVCGSLWMFRLGAGD